MKTFDNITEAREAIMDFRADHLKDLPEALQAKFKTQSASPSPVDQIVGTMELLYANKADLSDDAKDLVGGLAAFATVNAWHGLTDDNRGNLIVQAMRRDLGEKAPAGIKFQKAEDDSAPKEQFVIKPDEDAPGQPAAEVKPADTES